MDPFRAAQDDAGAARDLCGDAESFLDHFGLESARDLPGIKELRAAGLLDSRPMPGSAATEDEDEAAAGQSELFED
jgi:segregation and condensation protein B